MGVQCRPRDRKPEKMKLLKENRKAKKKKKIINFSFFEGRMKKKISTVGNIDQNTIFRK